MTSFYLSYLSKDPVSKNSHILRQPGVGLHQILLWGHNSAHNSVLSGRVEKVRVASTQVILSFTPVLQEGYPSHFVYCKITALEVKVAAVAGIQVVTEGDK